MNDGRSDASPAPATTLAQSLPVSPRLAPYYVEVRRGQARRWCACGLSANQPWCDGSHVGTGIEPVSWRAPADGEQLFCGCKRTATPPFCDGTHNSLVGVYGTDDPDSEANRAIAPVGFDPDGKARVDGGCFVGRLADRPWHEHGGVRWAELVSPADGAIHQALFVLELPPGAPGGSAGPRGHSPVIGFGDRQVALLFADADATLEIGDRTFPIQARPGLECGAAVLAGETFRLVNRRAQPLRVHLAVGPTIDAPQWPDAMSPVFDARHPHRVEAVDPQQRHAMAERYFQVLVNQRHGAVGLTQFIGEIPTSKAVPHRHLYEETLIVLSGRGTMWTENRKAPVETGDVIFLPRKQLHSLECTSTEPMQLVGVIHPGDNPGINYY